MADSSAQFEASLAMFGPSGTYQLQQLSGGLINETGRASCKHESFIMKYAPPYWSSIGPSAPISQERQVVEAAALGLFTPWLGGQLLHISRSADVFVPCALRHDSKNHVLYLTDFGESVSLTQFLTSNQGNNVGLQHAAETGSRLGRFFASLHSPSVFKIVQATEASKVVEKNMSDSRNLVRSLIIDPLESMMLRFGIDATEARNLAAAVTQDWTEAECSPKTTFVLDDSWTGSVLLRTEGEKLHIAVIDWEFATFDSSGICSDVATMLAHLKLRNMAAKEAGDGPVSTACEVLADEMAQSYRECSVDEAASWIRSMASTVNFEELGSLAKRVCIAIGRDMIHNASELDWDCKCCSSIVDNGYCKLRAKMVDEGVRILKAATSSSEDSLWKFISDDSALVCLFGIAVHSSTEEAP